MGVIESTSIHHQDTIPLRHQIYTTVLNLTGHILSLVLTASSSTTVPAANPTCICLSGSGLFLRWGGRGDRGYFSPYSNQFPFYSPLTVSLPRPMYCPTCVSFPTPVCVPTPLPVPTCMCLPLPLPLFPVPMCLPLPLPLSLFLCAFPCPYPLHLGDVRVMQRHQI